MTLHISTGPTRSGKSERAEALAEASGADVVYVATGRSTDGEMDERVAAHQARRPDHWSTVETVDLGGALRRAPGESTVLIDDLEGWLAAQAEQAGLWTDDDVAPLDDIGRAARQAVLAAAEAWCRLAAGRPGLTLVVAGQPGWGVVPMSASVRRWVDLHGEVMRFLSEAAEHVELLVAGRVLPLEVAPAAVVEDEVDLRDHGDTQVPPGAVDLAVNVLPGPPPWLADRLTRAVAGLDSYPETSRARRAAAHRHGRDEAECLLLNGAAEGFWLLAQELRPRHAVCIHPTFTEGEAALRHAGGRVQRLFRESERWTFDPARVPEEADLVLLTRPDNPTGALDPVAVVERLCRRGRTVVVDEAFADFLPEDGDLARRGDLPGLVVNRSLTKMWGIAGLRVGYLLADPALVRRLAAARQPWSVNSIAAEAIVATAEADAARRERAGSIAAVKDDLLRRLRGVDGLTVWPSAANYLLIRTERTDLRRRLLTEGFALRRGETFPGLDERYLRIAVRDEATSIALVDAIRLCLKETEQHE